MQFTAAVEKLGIKKFHKKISATALLPGAAEKICSILGAGEPADILDLLKESCYMARATALKSKKAYTNNGDNYAGSSVTVISAPNTLEEEIRIRAYLLYEQEGRQEGRDEEYWLRAESEILGRNGQHRS